MDPYPNDATTTEPEPLQAAPVLCRLDLWHAWSQWVDRGRGTVTTAKGGEVDVQIQDRVCLRCGKRESVIVPSKPR